MDPWLQSLGHKLYAFYLSLRSVPATSEPHLRLFNLISAKNTGFTSYYPNSFSPNRVVGAQISKLTSEQITVISNIMLTWKGTLPLHYFCAVSFQESQWDPQAFNKNLRETNGKETFQGTDWGFGQQSGYEVVNMPEMKGLTEAQMQAKLLDPNWSIPKMANEYKQLVTWANGITDNNLRLQLERTPTWFFAPGTKVSDGLDPYVAFVATLAYNTGPTGALATIANGGYRDKAGKYPDIHGRSVQTWMNAFYPLLNPTDTKT